MAAPRRQTAVVFTRRLELNKLTSPLLLSRWIDRELNLSARRLGLFSGRAEERRRCSSLPPIAFFSNPLRSLFLALKKEELPVDGYHRLQSRTESSCAESVIHRNLSNLISFSDRNSEFSRSGSSVSWPNRKNNALEVSPSTMKIQTGTRLRAAITRPWALHVLAYHSDPPLRSGWRTLAER